MMINTRTRRRPGPRPHRTALAACLLAAGACCAAIDAHAALRHGDAAAVLDDFKLLASARTVKCAGDAAAAPGLAGWHSAAPVCAWQSRLQMRRWEAAAQPAGPGATACVSAQARWWSWAQARVAAGVERSVWQDGWSRRSLVDEAYLSKRIAVIEQRGDGSWVATEWRWTPAAAPRARRKEERRWLLLKNAAHEKTKVPAAPDAFPQAEGLRSAWEARLGGRPAEVSAAGWRWQDGGNCLRMEQAGLLQAQVHLPYAQDDVRREQQSAMQVSLGRSYPNARWLAPFHVLPAAGRRSGGAVYEAAWSEDGMARAQLWMPRRDDGAVLSLRMAAAPLAGAGNEAAIREAAGLVRRELAALATAWSANHGL